MPLIYSLVARIAVVPAAVPVVVLADYTPCTGNFKEIAVQCLYNLNHQEHRFTLACDKHTFNFLRSNGFVYLAIADEAYGRQIPFAFLARVRDEFEAQYKDKGLMATTHGLSGTFGPRLKAHMDYCMAHPEELTKVAAVQKQVDDVKNIMVDNIDKIITRGEHLQALQIQAASLEIQAGTFKQRAGRLNYAMWWQYWRFKLLFLFFLILLVPIIFLLVCYSGDNHCTRKD